MAGWLRATPAGGCICWRSWVNGRAGNGNGDLLQIRPASPRETVSSKEAQLPALSITSPTLLMLLLLEGCDGFGIAINELD